MIWTIERAERRRWIPNGPFEGTIEEVGTRLGQLAARHRCARATHEDPSEVEGVCSRTVVTVWRRGARLETCVERSGQNRI